MKPGKRLFWMILSISAPCAILYLAFLIAKPVLAEIEPLDFSPGESIRLRGKNFGREQGRGRILLDGFELTNSSYLSWSDNEIEISLPAGVDSGLIQVARPFGKSGAQVLINSLRLPERPANLSRSAWGPSVTEVLPLDSGPGALIELRGINFGSELHASQVRFSRNPGRMSLEVQEPDEFSAALPISQRFVLPEDSLMYEYWDDKLIRVRVPEQAGSGPLVVSTPHGDSEPYHLRLGQDSGTKYRFDPVSYTLEFEIDIERKDKNPGGSLLLHVPSPPDFFSQSIDEVQAESQPFQWRKGDPASLVQLDGLPYGKSKVSRTLLITVYNVESELSSYKAGFTGSYSDPSSSGAAPQFLKPYLEAEALLPSGEKEVRTLAAAITGRERNLQRKAGLIRTWLASRLAWLPDSGSDKSVLQDLAKKKAGSRNYALIATSIFRAAGIPALPVAGFLVGDQGQGIPHFWMEYYLPAVGWIPYDPVLACGAVPEGFTPPFAGPASYFGALDNRHIAITRGIEQLHSRIGGKPEGQADIEWLFFDPLEESIGLDYSSDWKSVRILATY
jgi:hypothetical protein